jgi:hypothetical protein
MKERSEKTRINERKEERTTIGPRGEGRRERKGGERRY